jgi:hypothetical protein
MLSVVILNVVAPWFSLTLKKCYAMHNTWTVLTRAA